LETSLGATTQAISPPESATSPRFLGWTGVAARGVIVAVAIVLTWYTWARWGSFQADCGRELYVPGEILQGKLIYRDLFYPYGPLAPYVCALLIGVFGPHLVVFYLFGIAIAIGCALLLFELGTMLAGRAAGLTAGLAPLLMGFAPGIFNYVFPYSYAATLGLFLGLLCAWFTLKYVFARDRKDLLIAGFAAGLCLLTKQELGASCYAMLALVLIGEAILDRSLRPLVRGSAACAPGVVLSVAIYGWFFWTLTPTFMVDANWVGLPGTSMQAYGATLYFNVGQRFIPRELLILIVCAAVTLLLWFLLAKANWMLRAAVLAAVAALEIGHRFGHDTSMTGKVTSYLVFPRGMFFIGCGLFGYAIYKLRNTGDRRYLGVAAYAIFALIPGLRVIAKIEPDSYSIFCAIPLFLAFVIAIYRCIEAATPALSADRRRALVNYLLAAEAVMLAFMTIPQPGSRPATLETSWGSMHLRPVDAFVARQMLDFISEQKSLGRRVAVLPEAPILYVLTGTEAPGRWYFLVPGILSPEQEGVFLADLNRAAPDYIFLTARSTPEYGAAWFGIDYDQKIFQWIESNYRRAGQFGPFRRDTRSTGLAALLYQRRNLQGDRPR
jgi:hypothetical protein